MKIIKSKLTLNKRTITNLDSNEMANVKGGFTYALSTGYVCMISQGLRMDRETCQKMSPKVASPRFFASESDDSSSDVA